MAMPICTHCHNVIAENSRFCSLCGQPVAPAPQVQRQLVPAYPVPSGRAPVSAGGFGQLFGLEPRIVFLTMIVDTMLFGGQFLTLGTSSFLSLPVGIVLGFITYKAQRHWYRDDRESAIIKGLIVGLLTAIPTGLPGFLTIPSGVIGLVHLLRRKRMYSPLGIDRPAGSINPLV